METNQQELDRLLDRVHNIPVVAHEDGLIPTTAKYQPIHNIIQNGFSFSVREFLQAIGIKMVNIPLNDSDEPLNYALVYTKILDLESPHLAYKNGLNYGSDIQTQYSHVVGVGMSCLIASRCFGIPIDQLEPIPGRGTRFDYRGVSNSSTYIIESRGTKYDYQQSSQIEAGLRKKETVLNRGDKFDVGLIISTFIGENPEVPNIMIADPEYGDILFDGNRKALFRYRHFARVMQFIGSTRLSRKLYLESNNILFGRQSNQLFFKDFDQYDMAEMEIIEVDNSFYVGHWFDKWVPKESLRYNRLKSIELPAPLKSQPKMRISVFQGLLDWNYQAIRKGYIEDISISEGGKLALLKETHDGEIASIFPDGTILITKAYF